MESKGYEMTEWVDFAKVKKTISLQMVLSYYGVLNHLTTSGKNMYGVCPIHNGNNENQFSVNLKKNAWRCFGDCQNYGNQLDFVVAMEGIKGNQPIRRAALLLKNWFNVCGETSNQAIIINDAGSKKKSKLVRKKITQEGIHASNYNPIGFVLKPLNYEHLFFEERRIASEIAIYGGKIKN